MGSSCDEIVSELLSFCKSHKHIYMYGAGIIAQRYRAVLELLGQRISGCFISKGVEGDWHGFPVHVFSNEKRELGGDVGIILALSENKHHEVLNLLHDVRVDIWKTSDANISFLYNKLVLIPLFRRIATKCESLMSPLSSLKRILIIRTDVLGDLLMTIPFLRELKRNVPRAEIDLVIRKSNEFLMRDCPYITRLIIFTPNTFEEVDMAKLKAFSKANFSERIYDAVFLPRVMLSGRDYAENDILGMLCGAKYRIGRILANSEDYSDGMKQEELHASLEPFFTMLFWQSEPRHEVEYMLELVKGCGGRIADNRLEYWLTDGSMKCADELWKSYNIPANALCLAVGLVSKAANRTWGAEHYVEFCQIMREYNANIYCILLGGADAKSHAQFLSEYPNVIDLTGKTEMNQAAACIAKCNIYVGANTGLLHFAAALNKPVVEISAWLPDGSPWHGIAPSRMGAWGVPTRLCQPEHGKDDCHGACNKSYAHCINEISAKMVARNVIELLKQTVDD